ncbi:MAG: hypothetical protein IAG13_19160 [Deltaproteobacteria bacterium]|nr:hypothetical protein [Nannocystaceae bacterium]
MRFARGIAPVAAGMLLGVGLGCTIDLAHRIACGDGYVDPAAGEECDPQVPESYERACHSEYGGGVGGCDPTTCTLLVNDVQCAFCGDKEINLHPGQSADGDTDVGDDSSGEPNADAGVLEQCDRTELNGALCPDGVTRPTCNDDCTLAMSSCPPYCGDGEENVEEEECDPDKEDVSNGQQTCVPDLLGVGGIESPYRGKHVYGSGTAQCNITCRWDRLTCSYCGNGHRDESLLLDRALPNVQSPAEVCDGLDFDDDDVLVEFRGDCSALPNSETLRRNVRCNDECNGFEVARDEPTCCTRSGAACPEPGEPACCSAYLHADDVVAFEPCTPAMPFALSYCY